MGIGRAARVACVVGLLCHAGAARALGTPADEIVQGVRQAFSAVRDYRVKVFVHVDIEGFDVPDQVVDVCFRQPGDVRLDGPMPGLLPKENVVANPAQVLDEERYLIRRAGTDRRGGRSAQRLELFDRRFPPIEGEAARPDLVVWVDLERRVIVEMEAYAGDRRQGRVSVGYALVDDRFWLPESTRVEIDLETVPAGVRAPADSLSAHRPRAGTILLRFFDYSVNTGLPDSLFAGPEGGP